MDKSKKNSEIKLAVVIPCFNTAKHIKKVIETIPDKANHIIIIDDKCPQGSGKIAENLKNNKVIVIYHKKNRGVGGAVISGYKKAMELNCDIIVKMDGDGQMNPEYLDKLIMPIIEKKANYAKGNRFYDFKALQAMPKIRLIGNGILSFFTKAASGYWNITDVVNGYTAISGNALKNINLSKLNEGYFFEINMLIQIGIAGYVVHDIPIPAVYRDETSNMRIMQILTAFPFLLFIGLCKRIFYRYFIYDFNMASIYILLGLPMTIWGIAFGLYRWSVGIATGIPNNSGTIFIAVLPLILGVQFLLQAINIDIANIPSKNRNNQ
jgi:glycosyltransferase involved in cell wall biosynthesis